MNATVIARLLGSMVISSYPIGREVGEAVNKYLPAERRMDLDHMTGYQMEIMIHTLTEEQQTDLLNHSFGTTLQQHALMQGMYQKQTKSTKPKQKVRIKEETNKEETDSEADSEEEATPAEDTDEDDKDRQSPRWGFVGFCITILFISAYFILPQAGVTDKDVLAWLVWVSGGMTLIVMAWSSINEE